MRATWNRFLARRPPRDMEMLVGMGHALRSSKLRGGFLLAFALVGGCSDWEAPLDADPSSGGMLSTAGGGASGGGGASSGGQSSGGDNGVRCDRTAEPK